MILGKTDRVNESFCVDFHCSVHVASLESLHVTFVHGERRRMDDKQPKILFRSGKIYVGEMFSFF